MSVFITLGIEIGSEVATKFILGFISIILYLTYNVPNVPASPVEHIPKYPISVYLGSGLVGSMIKYIGYRSKSFLGIVNIAGLNKDCYMLGYTYLTSFND